MRQEQEAALGGVRLRRARDTAYEKLAEYVQGERFVPDLAEAMNLYWGGRLHPSQIQQVAQLHRLRSLDFFLFDYRTAEGDRIVERFTSERRLKLAPDEQKALKEWEGAYVGVFAVLRAEANTVLVRDLLLGDQKRIDATLPPPLVAPNIALVGRLAPASPPYFVHDLVLPMPAAEAQKLVDWLKPRLTAYRDRHPGAGWPEFMRAESQQVNYYLLEDAEFLPEPESPVAQPDANADLEVAQGIVRQMHGGLIIGTLDSHYSQFLDRPVEKWGHRSPRQLMADELGRARVNLWLEVLEQAEESRRAIGQPAYDVNRLRAQLGMMGPGVF